MNPLVHNRSLIAIFGLCLAIISCQAPEKVALSVNALFSDHMVLQQKKEVAFWGKYTPKGAVKVTGSWGNATATKADRQGNWRLQLPTPAAGGPFTIDIATADSTIQIVDVMAGEVWLASGQSNMSMPLEGWPPTDTILNSAQEISRANYPNLRMFTVARTYSSEPTDTLDGQWLAATPETAGEFSATAYFFARRLHQELGVPIGILNTSWGGTPAEAWTSQERLRSLGDFDKILNSLHPDSIIKVQEWLDRWPYSQRPGSEEDWKNLELMGKEAAAADFEDTNWPEIELPGRFDALAAGEMDGVVWLRKKFTIGEPRGDYMLAMGAIDDMDITFVNGQQVGGMKGYGYWNVDRTYPVPGSVLREGENTIAIQAVDFGGPGSVNSHIQLISKSGEAISLKGEWKAMPVAEIYKRKMIKYALGTDTKSRPNIRQFNQNSPSTLYNSMLHPLIPYTIKGAIWYQGESNVGRAEQYKKLFPGMIEGWRDDWETDFSFYFVQIAPFNYNNSLSPSVDQSQKLRDAQRYALKTTKTGMVVTMDIGNFTNIHPANKQDVGGRLAGLALANDYGKSLVASGPLYRSMEKADKAMLLTFDFVGAGLMAADGELAGFEIAGTDGKYLPAVARIRDNQVEVSHPSVTDPASARYAWADKGVATLFNKEGLPASSFTTVDD